MQKRWKLFRWLKLVLLLYGIAGIAIYYLQDYILFHPVALSQNHRYAFTAPHREINIPFSQNASLSIVQFTTPAPPRGVVLYFHGNKKNIGWYARYAPNFTAKGYELWMIDYPGYGKSTGKLTEDMLYDYAAQLYKLARSRFPADSIIIYGKSMGTGIAAQLASKRDCKALVLETPYYSLTSLAGIYFPVYPVGRMIHYRLPTNEYLKQVIAPVTIFHGTSDWVIPYRNARRLKALMKPGDIFVTIPGGGHNNLNDFPLFHRQLDSLLSVP
jgi:pimeloyl-ACP methyl ester carboxylesterase